MYNILMCGHEYIKGIKGCHAYFDEMDRLKGLFLFLMKRFSLPSPTFYTHTKTLPDTIS